VRAALRAPGAGLLVVGLAVGLFALALGLRDWYWPPFGVPGSNGFGFLDVRYFTSTWECVRAGVDIAVANPCDPLNRPLNYPRLWLAPADLGLGEGSTTALGAALAVMFLAAVAAVVWRSDLGDGLVYAAAVCSPSVMLGIERGNPDLLIFALVVAAVFLLRAASPWLRVAAHALFLFAALLKLYPVLAWGPLLRQERRWVAAGLGSIAALFALDIALTWDDVRAVQEAAPRDRIFAYGAPILGEHVGGTAVVILAAALVCAAVASSARRQSLPAPADGRELDLFLAGAGVYVGTFALAHNYNYRLAFLLLTLPQLLRWARDSRPAVPFAEIGLTLVLAALWLGASLAQFPLGLGEWWEDVAAGFPYDELVDAALAGYLAAGVALTLPRGTTLERRAAAYHPLRSLRERKSETP